jgi:serine/threonine protein kinase
MDSNGELNIGDFGISHHENTATLTVHRHYAPPEVLIA